MSTHRYMTRSRGYTAAIEGNRSSNSCAVEFVGLSKHWVYIMRKMKKIFDAKAFSDKIDAEDALRAEKTVIGKLNYSRLDRHRTMLFKLRDQDGYTLRKIREYLKRYHNLSLHVSTISRYMKRYEK
jgi:hypothetical protein